jgi:hypothetical protein
MISVEQAASSRGYVLTPDGQRVVISYTKLHNRLLRLCCSPRLALERWGRIWQDVALVPSSRAAGGTLSDKVEAYVNYVDPYIEQVEAYSTGRPYPDRTACHSGRD